MKKLLFVIILLALAGLGFYHIPKHADGIEGDIHKRLSRVMLEKNVPKSIIAKVDGRDVILSGEANSQRLKKQVHAFAENLTGVRTVTNNIQVSSLETAESSYEPEINIERPANDLADMSITRNDLPEAPQETPEKTPKTIEMPSPVIELETGSAVIGSSDVDANIEIDQMAVIEEKVEMVEREIETVSQMEMPPPPVVAETVKIETAPSDMFLENIVEAEEVVRTERVVERVVAIESGPVSAQSSACQNKLSNMMADQKINFDSGRSTIKSNSYGLLNKLVAQVKNCENVVVHIHGHTDSSGDATVNRALSLKRAKSVGRYMISKGVRKEIRVVGHGASQPIASNDTEAGKAQNRRIEFKITAQKN